MKRNQLDKLVSERQRKCQENHIYIDTIQGKAKGYTKAHNSQNNTPQDKNILEESIKNTSLTQKVRSIKPSGISLFNKLGVDCIG